MMMVNSKHCLESDLSNQVVGSMNVRARVASCGAAQHQPASASTGPEPPFSGRSTSAPNVIGSCTMMGLLRGWQDGREFLDPLRREERSMTQFQFHSGGEVIDGSTSVGVSIPA